MEQLILKIDRQEDSNNYGWEDNTSSNCVLNIGLDLGEPVIETCGQVKAKLKRLAKDGFIKKQDIKKFAYSINRFDGNCGSKIDLNRVIKLAIILGFGIRVHPVDEDGYRCVADYEVNVK